MEKKTISEFLVAWTDGEHPMKLEATLHEPRVARVRKKIVLDEKSMYGHLVGFLRRYSVFATILAAALFIVLLIAALGLPEFGAPENPTNNIVAEEYLNNGPEQTGGENVVTAMIFTYRGFDTLGESFVLFLAFCCVLVLLRREKAERSLAEQYDPERDEQYELKNRDVIFSRMSRLLTPCVFLYGFYILFGGESSPGGGFSAGSALGAGLILYASSNGVKKTRRFMNRTSFTVIRTAGLLTYAVLFGIYILIGSNAELAQSFSKMMVLPIDAAVGLVVMCTMYGFYAMFTRGEV